MAARDSAELASVSTDFEQMGDQLSPPSMPSHTRLWFTGGEELEESASECARRASALVERLRASTPASTAARNR